MISKEEQTRTFFVTKYALTKGILVGRGYLVISSIHEGEQYVRMTNGGFYRVDQEAFLVEKDARKKATEMAIKKMASLKSQLKKMELLAKRFQEGDIPTRLEESPSDRSPSQQCNKRRGQSGHALAALEDDARKELDDAWEAWVSAREGKPLDVRKTLEAYDRYVQLMRQHVQPSWA